MHCDGSSEQNGGGHEQLTGGCRSCGALEYKWMGGINLVVKVERPGSPDKFLKYRDVLPLRFCERKSESRTRHGPCNKKTQDLKLLTHGIDDTRFGAVCLEVIRCPHVSKQGCPESPKVHTASRKRPEATSSKTNELILHQFGVWRGGLTS